MMSQLTKGQKFIAYGSLLFVLAWTIFGLFAIWLMTSEG